VLVEDSWESMNSYQPMKSMKLIKSRKEMLFRDLIKLKAFKGWLQKLMELEKEVLSGHQRDQVENIRELDQLLMALLENLDLQRRMPMLLFHQEFTQRIGFNFEIRKRII
jgi:hypothetical protein